MGALEAIVGHLAFVSGGAGMDGAAMVRLYRRWAHDGHPGLERDAAVIAALEAERDALRAKVAALEEMTKWSVGVTDGKPVLPGAPAAPVLRLWQAPTNADLARHVAAFGRRAQFMGGCGEVDPVNWERLVIEEDDGRFYIDGAYQLGDEWDNIVDAIFLDSDGNPCPVGGWPHG